MALLSIFIPFLLTPPRSTLFPYTTLFRSRSGRTAAAGGARPRARRSSPLPQRADLAERRARRSEEHTSELQSPDHLVCRLLLEKKKKRTLPSAPSARPLYVVLFL